jgi:hypothetical protein
MNYEKGDIPVRKDLEETHLEIWQSIASAGTWLEGAKRVEIARETRQAACCPFCVARKEALSPYAQPCEHETVSTLGPVEVDVVHRIVTDSSRITQKWIDGLQDEGIDDACYVEMMSVVNQVLVMDNFCVALGIPLTEIPDSLPGLPSCARPASAIKEGAFVAWIPAAEKGPDSDLFKSRLVANMYRAMSLVPDAVRASESLMVAHYVPYKKVPIYTDADHDRALGKSQMELVAARVSYLNDCLY